MSTIEISLPDEMRVWLDDQAAKGGYGSAGEYLFELIRQDQRKKAEEELEAKLLEGLNAEGTELTESVLDEIRNEAMKRIEADKELDAKLLEGLNSEEVEVNEEFWQTIKDEAMKQISSKRVA